MYTTITKQNIELVFLTPPTYKVIFFFFQHPQPTYIRVGRKIQRRAQPHRLFRLSSLTMTRKQKRKRHQVSSHHHQHHDSDSNAKRRKQTTSSPSSPPPHPVSQTHAILFKTNTSTFDNMCKSLMSGRCVYPHQLRALQAMWQARVRGHGFVLADDMGLGKTFEMLSLLRLMSLTPLCGTRASVDTVNVVRTHTLTPTRYHLIVAPLSLLTHWQDEIYTTFQCVPTRNDDTGTYDTRVFLNHTQRHPKLRRLAYRHTYLCDTLAGPIDRKYLTTNSTTDLSSLGCAEACATQLHKIALRQNTSSHTRDVFVLMSYKTLTRECQIMYTCKYCYHKQRQLILFVQEQYNTTCEHCEMPIRLTRTRQPHQPKNTVVAKPTSILPFVHWNNIVLDEAHLTRNPKTHRYSACRMVTRHAQYVYALTGTPFNNTIQDMATLASLVLSPSHPSAKSEYWLHDHHVAQWKRQYFMRRLKHAVLKLPRIKTRVIDVDMDTCTKRCHQVLCAKAYRASQRYQHLDATLHKEARQRLKQNILLSMLRLRQVCCSPWLLCKDAEALAAELRPTWLHLNVTRGHVPMPRFLAEGDATQPVSLKVLLNDSAKLRRIACEVVAALNDRGETVVVFSSMTTFLGLLRRVLTHMIEPSYIYMYHGQLDLNDRDAVIRRFRQQKKPSVLLASLKAGGLGLNLTCANHVMLAEPWYNPFVETQAQDRVYRLGQTRPVTITHFYMRQSIESMFIRKLQEHKRYHARRVLSNKSDLFSASVSNKFRPSLKALINFFSTHVDTTFLHHHVSQLTKKGNAKRTLMTIQTPVRTCISVE